MTPTAKISCRVTATAPGLILAARINDQEFWRGDPWGGHAIAIDVADDDGQHVLAFELSGKLLEHTKISDSGEILQDITVSVEDVSFDEIKLGHLFYQHATYEHDHNGTGAVVQDTFYGTMGCNGTVRLAFTTPIYLWLLENM